MRMLIIYHMDGSRQVIKPRQEVEKKGEKDPKNFCGDWHGLVQAITKGYYLKYEVI